MNRKLLAQAASRLPVIHIRMSDGRFQVIGINRWHSYWRDPYHLLLTIPWHGFTILAVLFYVLTNALFALLYLLGGDGIANAQPDSFRDAFFFSVQTLASIGYGAMYPESLYANWIVTLEAIVSILGIALLTGLAFARFSRPTARVLFSQVAVVAPYEGIPTLMFRAANRRRNQILEAQMRVYLMRDEITAEGNAMRRFYDLPLLRSQTPSFTLSWTAMHAIDENSPLWKATPESLRQARATIAISLNGLDETVSQTMYARYNYAPQDILWNSRFVDIFHVSPEGHRYIDYRDFHKAVPVD
jgi:inward rectifier potassium channel